MVKAVSVRLVFVCVRRAIASERGRKRDGRTLMKVREKKEMIEREREKERVKVRGRIIVEKNGRE